MARIVLAAALAAAPASQLAADDTVAVFAPYWLSYNPAFAEGLEAMGRDLDLVVEWQSVPRWDLARMIDAEQRAAALGAEAALWLGPPKNFVATLVEAGELRPAELEQSGAADAAFGLSRGTVRLGYGWQSDGASNAPVILSVPYGRDPVLPAATLVVTAPDGDVDAAGEVGERVAEWLRDSDSGRAMVHGLTLIPEGAEQRVEVRPRSQLSDDDNGCGCEDSQLQTCDPDGYVLDLAELLSSTGGAVIPDREDDDDGCGGGACEASYNSLDGFLDSRLAEDLRAQMPGTFDDHVEGLQQAAAEGLTVVVLTCDPDG